MNKLTLGSLFDGSGGFPLAGLLTGIHPVWASEVEPFPIRVTTKRLPFIKHYGDISKMDGAKVEPVDIITFGSPCQDMSIAGKRAGLDGNRSNLFYEAIRIIKEMRCKTNGKYPRYIVWENVPGAFSSNKGEDFKLVLEKICQVKDETISIPKPEKWMRSGQIVGDDFSVSWRVLDSQYWGVPQRRKRIFLVADFNGGGAPKILFESEGMSGYSSKGFRPWQRATSNSKESIGETGSYSIDGYNSAISEIASTLGVNCGISTGRNGVMEQMLFENHGQAIRYKGPLNVSPTLSSVSGSGGNNLPFVCENPKNWDGGQIASTLTSKNAGGNQRMPDKNNFNCILQPYGICSKDSNAMKSCNPESGVYKADTSRTVDCNGGNPSCNQGGIAVVESYSLQGNMIGRKHSNGPQGDGINKDISFTLNSTDRHAVFSMSTGGFPQIEKEKTPTLMARDYKDPHIVNENIPYGFYPQMKAECVTMLEDKSVTIVNGTNPGYQNGVVESEYCVRRLTPTECARLQGFPDFWCSNLDTPEPTMEEIKRWYEIFETHRKVIGKSTKPKSIKQIIKWLKSPHSDSAEYKMWGNGVALPCVAFVLAGIVWYSQSNGE